MVEPVLVPVWPDAANALGLGRTKTFEEVAAGRLRTVRVGRRRLVPVDALHEYVSQLEAEAA